MAKVPWNWDKIMEKAIKKKKRPEKVLVKSTADIIKERRGQFAVDKETEIDFNEEVDFWNACYEY